MRDDELHQEVELTVGLIIGESESTRLIQSDIDAILGSSEAPGGGVALPASPRRAHLVE